MTPQFRPRWLMPAGWAANDTADKEATGRNTIPRFLLGQGQTRTTGSHLCPAIQTGSTFQKARPTTVPTATPMPVRTSPDFHALGTLQKGWDAPTFRSPA